MRRFFRHFLFLGLNLAACTQAPTATRTPREVMAIPLPQNITFATPDGAEIKGLLYGSGSTVVIFSVMGNCKRGWEDMAQLVAQNGMKALTYPWRGCRESGNAVDSELRKFVDDLRGAIRFIRDQGVEKIVLAGASLGGVVSAKLAVESSPNGLIILASPREIEAWNFEIGPGDVNIDMPKLFVTADKDSVVDPGRTRELFDLAAEPKEWQTYPGTAHGTDLFETENGEALQKRILDFILAIAAKS